MKKFLKIIFLIIILFAIALFIFIYKNNEPLPKGINNKEADILASKMLIALNKKKFDNANIITWSFRNKHFYKWYKQDKVFDTGTERSLVKYKDKDALLVTYTSGGSTPGDSYLWILDDNYIPISYKMWVKIIPIGGFEATWSDWITTDAGFKLPAKHTFPVLGVDLMMGDIKGLH